MDEAGGHQLTGLVASGPAIPHFRDYARRLSNTLESIDWRPAELLADELLQCWRAGHQLFLAGNGGSASNANHLANDFMYPLSRAKGVGIRAHALTENPAVITCLANDEGYESALAFQLSVLGRAGDILLAFSGSGNSPNILRLIEEARAMKIRSFAVLGYSGGKAKQLADVPIHFPVDDMQIAEDTQTVLGHMLMQWLHARRHTIVAEC
jgi:D-sedoheptulose 7-phosphate isomerase